VGRPSDTSGATAERCARFLELEELAIAGQTALAEDDHAFIRSHVRDCAECAALIEVLEGFDDPPPLPPGMVERVLDDHETQRSRRRRNAALLLGGLTAAAAAVAIVLYGLIPSPADQHDPGEHETALVSADGLRWHEGGAITTADEPLRLRRGDQLTLALDRATRAQVDALSNDNLALSLEEGTLAAEVDPQAAIAVAVQTRLGRVLVKGTVFAVEITGGEVRVEVIRGSVTVESPDLADGATEVSANQSLAVRARSVTPLAAPRRDQILALLGIAAGKDAQNEPTPAVEIAVLPSEEEPTKAERKAGAAATGSAHKAAAIEQEAAPAAPDAEDQQEQPIGPGDLIRTARQQRLAGDWNGAAETYRQVLALHPSRPESVTVLLPLAEIELQHLGRPDLALRHFTSYSNKRPSGPLAEEAFHGRCAALRALGQRQREAAALEEFLRRFPGSMHAPSARARLKSISDIKGD
jgi:ferric-dicitrate binding protein FerR (iron transport regulator)/TolA-binding protein